MSNAVVIDESKCTGCMLCGEVCLINFEKNENNKAHGNSDSAFCIECGHCAAVCPTQAISVSGTDMSQIQPIDRDAIPGYEQFLAFLKSRRSRREFADREVPKEEIEKLLAAAVQAPNGCNRQNVRYIVITDSELLRQIAESIGAMMRKLVVMIDRPVGGFIFKTLLRKTYRELEPYLPLMREYAKILETGRDVVLYDAPCLILVMTEKNDGCGPEDAVYAAANIGLTAETLGLGTCVLGFVTHPVNGDPRLKRLLRVPDNYKVQTSMVVGYPKFQYASAAPKLPPKVDWVE